MRLWIVGAHGQLGRALCMILSRFGIAHLATGREIDVGSASEVLKVAREQAISHCINCSAYTAVDKAESEESLARAVNALGPENLGRAATRVGAKVIHISTDYVFDGAADEPYPEEAPRHPINAYGRTKCEGEERLLRVHSNACIVRTSWLFGLGGKNFVETMLKVMHERSQIEVVADQLGRPTFASDLAAVILRLLPESGIYHFANSGVTSWHGFACEIQRQANALGAELQAREILPIDSSAYKQAAKRPAYSVLSTERVERLLRQAPRPWTEALADYLKETLAARAPYSKRG